MSRVTRVGLEDCPTGGTKYVHESHEWEVGAWPFRRRYHCGGLTEQRKWELNVLVAASSGSMDFTEFRLEAEKRLVNTSLKILPPIHKHLLRFDRRVQVEGGPVQLSFLCTKPGCPSGPFRWPYEVRVDALQLKEQMLDFSEVDQVWPQ